MYPTVCVGEQQLVVNNFLSILGCKGVQSFFQPCFFLVEEWLNRLWETSPVWDVRCMACPDSGVQHLCRLWSAVPIQMVGSMVYAFVGYTGVRYIAFPDTQLWMS